MGTCRICSAPAIMELLDFGRYPISNRYVADPAGEQYLHPLVIGQCSACGLVQLISPVTADKLVSPYDWITYNEPEGHLDKLADIVSTLPGITRDATICGISYKDDSLLARLKDRGFHNTWRIDPVVDLGITAPGAGVEMIQDRLRPDTAGVVREKYGTPDVAIVRQILEHTDNTVRFTEALSRLARPEGYIVFESPDCSRLFDTCDYAGLWEEHILYFTPDTLQNGLALAGFSVFRFENHLYPYENCMVCIVTNRTHGKAPIAPSNSIPERERSRVTAYVEGFRTRRDRVRRSLAGFRQAHGKIAVYGAGHLACMFLNIMGVTDHIEFVVDEDPHKQGLYMPGSTLPICGPDALIKEDIKLCLTTFPSETEKKVIQKNRAFLERGGRFASIFPHSIYDLRA